MRALLLTVGSQGDVQPYVALASRLRSAGHDVVLAASAGYRGLAEPALVPFVPLDLDMAAVGHAVEGKHGLRHMLAFTKAMGRRAMIFGLIAAANRDPAQVKEPETFDLTREQVSSLSLGAGPHYCLGAYLAGLQGEVLFPRLLRAFPAMRQAGEPVYRAPGSTLRCLDRLPLTLWP